MQRIVVAAKAGGDQPWLADAAAEAMARQLGERGVEATPHTLHGPVVRSGLLFAEDRDADLIVCGASSRGPVARRVLGDVPIPLIRRARRPVLVITPPAGRS